MSICPHGHTVCPYTFCPYTFCRIIPSVFLDIFFCIRFVSLSVLLLHLLSSYVLSFRCYVVIRSVVRRLVVEPFMCILICTTYMPSKCGERCYRCIQTEKLRTVFCVLFVNILLDVNRAAPATFWVCIEQLSPATFLVSLSWGKMCQTENWPIEIHLNILNVHRAEYILYINIFYILYCIKLNAVLVLLKLEIYFLFLFLLHAVQPVRKIKL
jgi:hypothetical protein